jgi:pimeloyl-ACP methyl ester carboxylesterase
VRDRLLPTGRHTARFRREIPGVEFRLLPGLGHTPMCDDPGLIAATIGEFAAAATRDRSTAAEAA